jgi:3-methyladenine DNA glycosylase Tag
MAVFGIAIWQLRVGSDHSLNEPTTDRFPKQTGRSRAQSNALKRGGECLRAPWLTASFADATGKLFGQQDHSRLLFRKIEGVEPQQAQFFLDLLCNYLRRVVMVGVELEH